MIYSDNSLKLSPTILEHFNLSIEHDFEMAVELGIPATTIWHTRQTTTTMETNTSRSSYNSRL